MVTYTSNKKLNKPSNGEFPDTWDVPVNQDWDIIDKALGSAVTFTVGASDITLTISDAQNQRIVLTGTPGASRYIIIPFQYLSATTAVGGMWIVDNQTNADQYVITEASGSTGITVASGRKALVYSDGTDVKFADETRLLAGNGILVSGSTVALSAPVSTTNGGTGISAPTAGSVLIGNGASALSLVAPGASGNVLTSNGSTWTSAAPTGGGGGSGITSIGISSSTGLIFTPSPITTPGGTFTMSGTLSINNGGTGVTTIAAGFVKSTGSTLSGGNTVNINSGSTDISGTLSITSGGTGATSSAGALSNLGGAPLSNPTFSGTASANQFTITNTSTNVIGFMNNSTSYYMNYNPFTGIFGTYMNGVMWSCTTSSFVVPGSMTASNYITSSDARIKKDIKPYIKSVDAVSSLTPVTFQYNGQYGTIDNGAVYVGLIAQEVQNSEMSSMVNSSVYTDPKTGQQTTIYGISQNDVIFALINCIKELNTRVKALEAKVGP